VMLSSIGDIVARGRSVAQERRRQSVTCVASGGVEVRKACVSLTSRIGIACRA
jgi:hypothetical protein